MVKFRMKSIILFDIDRTVINTDFFIKKIESKISRKTNITIDEISKTKKLYISSLDFHTDFYPTDFLKFLSDFFKKDSRQLEKIYHDRENYKDLLFEETFDVLEKLKDKFILGIFSEGFLDFQAKKLKNTKILNFFNPKYMFIERRKMRDEIVNKLPKNSIIVDDNEDIIKELFFLKKFNPVWINRKDERKLENIRTIKNLKELL